MQDHFHNNRPPVDLIRCDQLPGRALPDAPSQRARQWAMVLILSTLALSLYLFLNTSQLVGRLQGHLAAVEEDSDAARIRQYNEKLESLQDRMTVFVADSVETKLKTLESKVVAGAVGIQEVKTLEELKGEVKLLEKYSVGKGGRLTDSSRLDHVRFQATPSSQNTASNSELLYEVAQMKHLLYLSIASCGLVGLMIGGHWWQSQSRLKRLANGLPARRLLAGKSMTGE